MRRALAMAVITAALTACGGGGSSSTSDGSSAGGDDTATTQGEADSSSEPSTPATLPAADPSLSAAGLLDVDGYAAALGEPVAAVEDDGGYPVEPAGHRSTARVALASGVVYDLVLLSAATEEDAVTEYQQEVGPPLDGFPPLAGVGDDAIVFGDRALVRKGAQVLTIQLDENSVPADLIDIEDPKASFDELGAKIALMVVPAAAALSGTAAPDPVLALPPGAVDPCLIGGDTAAILEDAAEATGVVARYEPPISGPGVTCRLEGDGLPTAVVITTITQVQLESAAPPSTVADQFAADVAAATDPEAAATDHSLVDASGENVEFVVDGPVPLLVHIDFSGLVSVPCLRPDELAKLLKEQEQLDERIRQDRAHVDADPDDPDPSSELFDEELAQNLRERLNALPVCR